MLTLFRQIKEDWHCHGRDWTLPGFRAVSVHRFGVWRMGLKKAYIRKPLSVLYRLLYRRARNVYGIEIPYTVELGKKVIIEHQHGIVIHGLAKIGDECIIRQGVTIGVKSVKDLKGVPIIGNRVDIGAGAQLLGKITIGDDVVIGANAVVISDVPAGLTVVGIPAKPVKRDSTSSANSDNRIYQAINEFSQQDSTAAASEEHVQ